MNNCTVVRVACCEVSHEKERQREIASIVRFINRSGLHFFLWDFPMAKFNLTRKGEAACAFTVVPEIQTEQHGDTCSIIVKLNMVFGKQKASKKIILVQEDSEDDNESLNSSQEEEEEDDDVSSSSSDDDDDTSSSSSEDDDDDDEEDEEDEEEGEEEEEEEEDERPARKRQCIEKKNREPTVFGRYCIIQRTK